MNVEILSENDRVICRGIVEAGIRSWSGELLWLDDELHDLFSAYESYVNDQIIPLAEATAALLESNNYRVRFTETGVLIPVSDLQVLPAGRGLFFRSKHS